jgi:hypothetical protein
MKVTRYITSYTFPKPSRLTEPEFAIAKQSLPIKPHIDVFGELVKKYGLALAVRCVFFFVPSGTLTSAYNYYSMLIDKKKFYNGLYEAIYSSESYLEYCKKYERLAK